VARFHGTELKGKSEKFARDADRPQNAGAARVTVFMTLGF
jgi:hypothetical protein